MSDCASHSTGSNVKRKTRNESEKRRRDAFNRIIAELTALVADGDRKIDKSNVLKCAISFLKERQLRAESTTESLSSGFESRVQTVPECSPRDVARLYVDALSAGTFCIACTGRVRCVSTAFASLFALSSSEMRGTNILDLLESTSSSQLEETLSSEVLRAAAASCSSGWKPSADSPLVRITVVTRAHRTHIFMIGTVKRVSLNRPNSDTSEDAIEVTDQHPPPDEDEDPNDQSDTTLCFVGVARPQGIPPPMEITADSLGNAYRKASAFSIVYNNEFVCVHVEHTCLLLLGYSRLEMLGSSGYDFIHSDDLAAVADSHRQVMKRGSDVVNAHRLRTRSGQWLWVRCDARFESLQHGGQRVRCAYTITNRPDSMRDAAGLLRSASLSSSSQRIHTQRASLDDGSFGRSSQSQTLLPVRATSVQPQVAQILHPLDSPTNQNRMTRIPSSEAQPRCTPSLFSPTPLRVSNVTPFVDPTASVCVLTSVASDVKDSRIEPQPTVSTPVSRSSRRSPTLKVSVSALGSASAAATNAAGETLHVQRTKRLHSFESVERGSVCSMSSPASSVLSPTTSETALAASASSAPFVSPVCSPLTPQLSPKRRLQQPLAYIEHFPLPETTIHSSFTSCAPSDPTHLSSFTDRGSTTQIESPFAISPMYRHVWEELQRKSELLRQQVIQKEMELQQLHLRQLLTNMRDDKPQ